MSKNAGVPCTYTTRITEIEMMNHQKENDLGDVQRQTARGRSRYSGPKKSDATTSNFDRVQSRSPLNFRNYAVLCPYM